MKKLIKDIKLLGSRDWLICLAPKPLSYIGELWDWILPRHRCNWHDKIRCFFKPRQKWIKKHIEYNEWCDKVELIPNFLFGCVINYVDEEKCFEYLKFDGSLELEKFAAELKKCYGYAKNGRGDLEKQLDEAYPKIGDLTSEELTFESYEEKYAEVHRLEEEISKLDKRYMTWIVANKNFMRA